MTPAAGIAPARPRKTGATPAAGIAPAQPRKTGVTPAAGIDPAQPRKTGVTPAAGIDPAQPRKTGVTAAAGIDPAQPRKTGVTPAAGIAPAQPRKTSVTPAAGIAPAQPGKTSVTPAAGIAPAHAPSYATPVLAPQARPTSAPAPQALPMSKTITMRTKTMHMLGKIGIAAVVCLAALFALAAPVPPLPNVTQARVYRVGRFFAAVVLPFLIAYPIAGRRKARNPNLFAALFCGMALLMILANAAGSLGLPETETVDQRASRLMREAAGLQRVRNSFFREETEETGDTKLRDFFKQIIAINKDYQAEAGKLDISAIASLNTPQSFADPNSAAEGLRQLHAAYELDARQEQRMSEVLENFRRVFDNLPSSDRESMLKGFNQGLAQVNPTRQRAVTTEKAWIDSLDDVYGFARAKHRQFRMADGHLQVTGEATRQEFSRRIRAVNASRQEFLKAKSDFDRLQGQLFQETGITRNETGLH